MWGKAIEQRPVLQGEERGCCRTAKVQGEYQNTGIHVMLDLFLSRSGHKGEGRGCCRTAKVQQKCQNRGIHVTLVLFLSGSDHRQPANVPTIACTCIACQADWMLSHHALPCLVGQTSSPLLHSSLHRTQQDVMQQARQVQGKGQREGGEGGGGTGEGFKEIL